MANATATSEEGSFSATVSASAEGIQCLLDGGGEQVLLAGEMPIQRRRSDRDGVGHIAHGHPGVSLAGEQVGGRVENQLAAVRGAGAALRSDHSPLHRSSRHVTPTVRLR